MRSPTEPRSPPPRPSGYTTLLVVFRCSQDKLFLGPSPPRVCSPVHQPQRSGMKNCNFLEKLHTAQLQCPPGANTLYGRRPRLPGRVGFHVLCATQCAGTNTTLSVLLNRLHEHCRQTQSKPSYPR